MFKRLVIDMAGPICNCEEESLAWGPFNSKDSKPELHIWCTTCATKLIVPNQKFIASFTFQTPYPKGKKVVVPKADDTPKKDAN